MALLPQTRLQMEHWENSSTDSGEEPGFLKSLSQLLSASLGLAFWWQPAVLPCSFFSGLTFTEGTLLQNTLSRFLLQGNSQFLEHFALRPPGVSHLLSPVRD